MAEPLPTTHYLLPYERRVAARASARQKARSTPTTRKMQQNYGPEGVVLMSAAIANAPLTILFGLIGVALSLASGALAVVGYLMFVPMVVFASIGVTLPHMPRAN